MNVLKLVFLMSLVVVIGVKSETLTDETGDINNFDGGDISYKIRPLSGSHIIIQINRIRLQNNRYIKLRDGRRGNELRYTAQRSGIYDGSGNALILPIVFETKSPKLYITVSGEGSGSGDGFSAHYASYSNGGCRKVLHHSDHPEVENISCDNEELIPVANTCDVRIRCAENYVQYRFQRTCGGDGYWEGDIGCLPDRDMLGGCSYNFDNMTANTECPFDIREVVEYYVDIEDVDPYEKGKSLGRSSGKRHIKCKKICAIDQRGSFVFKCPKFFARRNRQIFVKCLICRMRIGCDRGVNGM